MTEVTLWSFLTGGAQQPRQQGKNATSWMEPTPVPEVLRVTLDGKSLPPGLKGPFAFNLEIPPEEFQQSRFKGVISG